MPFVGDRWALLRIRFEGPFIIVHLRDSEGRTLRVSDDWTTPSPIGPSGWRLGACLPPIVNRLRELAEPLPQSRPAPHGTGPVPLPVFIQASRTLQGDEVWHRIVSEIEQELGPQGPGLVPADRFQFVTFTGSLRRRRPPFSLPLDIVAHGMPAHDDVARLQTEVWVQDEAVRASGFRIETPDDTEPLDGILLESEVDVLITDRIEALAICGRLPRRRRPRLIVLKEGFDPDARVPAGVAVVWAPRLVARLDQRVSDLLFGLVHDLPIHEAVKAAERSAVFPANVPFSNLRLCADPWTNQSLRLRDALVRLQTELERLELTLPGADLQTFLQRAGKTDTTSGRLAIRLQRRFRPPRPRGGGKFEVGLEGPDPFERAGKAYENLLTLRTNTASERKLPADFEAFAEEGQGLVPMSRSLVTATRLRSDAALATDALSFAAADPDLQAILDEHQQRTVDVAMQRLDTSPLLTSLDAQTTLAAGAAYRLRVHIGNPQPDSLILGDRPPIDPLLPPPDDEGHLLDVVVQAKRFGLESPRSRPLRLPRFGGSAPVYFTVRAPREIGEASLRIHIYHQNHLVQSYLLETEVSADEISVFEHHSRPLTVTLAYSRVENLGQAGSMAPRALSIGSNSNGSGTTTHDLIVKGTGTSGEMTLPGPTFKAEVKAFRDALIGAARDPNDAKKGRAYPVLAAGQSPSSEVADLLRGFAQQGNELYKSFFRRVTRDNPTLQGELVRLRTLRDQKIQILRFNENDVFPWTLLYDYILPDRNAGDPEPPVCLGHTLDAKDEPVPCAHTPDSPVICMNGFWSVRHYLEELLGRGVDPNRPVTRPAADAVRVLCDADLPGAQGFETEMQKVVAAPHLAIGPTSEKKLLDLLWENPPARPSILIVVGHMATGDQPRITLVRPAEWLTEKHIGDRLIGAPARWTQPRSIVLLMACDSAATTMNTINNFEVSLWDAGAAAVVGAETIVPSKLAMRCAQEVTGVLWANQPLGVAMSRFRRRLLAIGNPLAFLFHALGDVDLTLA